MDGPDGTHTQFTKGFSGERMKRTKTKCNSDMKLLEQHWQGQKEKTRKATERMKQKPGGGEKKTNIYGREERKQAKKERTTI